MQQIFSVAVPASRSQLNINCAPELLERLRSRARLESVSLTELVKALLEAQLDELGPELPLSERLITIESRLAFLESQLGRGLLD